MFNFDQLLANEEQYLLAEQQELGRSCEEAFKKHQVPTISAVYKAPRLLHLQHCYTSCCQRRLRRLHWLCCRPTVDAAASGNALSRCHMHAGAACGGHSEGGAAGHRQQGQSRRGTVPQGRGASGGLALASR